MLYSLFEQKALFPECPISNGLLLFVQLSKILSIASIVKFLGEFAQLNTLVNVGFQYIFKSYFFI